MYLVRCDQCDKELGERFNFEAPMLNISRRGGKLVALPARKKVDPIYRINESADLCSLACGVLYLKEKMENG